MALDDRLRKAPIVRMGSSLAGSFRRAVRPAGTSASPSSARSAASPTGSSRRIAALACSWVLVACAGASDPAPLPPEPEDRSSAPGWLPEPRRYDVGQRWTEEVAPRS